MTTKTTTAAELMGPGRGGQISWQHKRGAMFWLLRSKDLETLSRTPGVTAATLSSWHDTFLSVGEAGLANRPADAGDLKGSQLKVRLGEMLFDCKLLEAWISTLAGRRLLVRRRSRR